MIIKHTHREKVPWNKTPARIKGMNMDIWLVGTSNQVFLRGSYTETKISKNKVVTRKIRFYVIGRFCVPRSICLNRASDRAAFYGLVTFSILKYLVFRSKSKVFDRNTTTIIMSYNRPHLSRGILNVSLKLITCDEICKWYLSRSYYL